MVRRLRFIVRLTGLSEWLPPLALGISTPVLHSVPGSACSTAASGTQVGLQHQGAQQRQRSARTAGQGDGRRALAKLDIHTACKVDALTYRAGNMPVRTVDRVGLHTGADA